MDNLMVYQCHSAQKVGDAFFTVAYTGGIFCVLGCRLPHIYFCFYVLNLKIITITRHCSKNIFNYALHIIGSKSAFV